MHKGAYRLEKNTLISVSKKGNILSKNQDAKLFSKLSG